MSEFLPSTKFINVARTVTASTVVEDSDQVLDCDTTLSAITVTLKQIPANYWSTLYRLYVKDSGNNAATNNITIVAPTGYKINGASSLIINTNGAAAVIQITTNTDYLCTVAYGSGSATTLTSANTSTIQTVLTPYAGGYNVSSNVKYLDYMFARLGLSDKGINYFPKTPIYDAAGVILPTYFSDLNYAQTLGNQQAIKAYNSAQYSGAFSSANLNGTTGEITFPVDGMYYVEFRQRIAMASSSTGVNSTISSNPSTLGLTWNSDTTLKKTCLFQIGLYSSQYTAIECAAEKTLSDCGNYVMGSSVIRPYTAGTTIKLLFINNTDLDIYGTDNAGSDVEFIVIKISET